MDYITIIRLTWALSSYNFLGFGKDGNDYYSSGYRSGESNIEVDIKTGASGANGEFY